MDKQTIEVMKDFVKKIKRVIDVEKIIVFGSRARGDYLKESDFDLIVISKDFRGINFYDRPNKLLLLWNKPTDIEIFCYTPEEFEIKKTMIGTIAQAVKEGVVVK